MWRGRGEKTVLKTDGVREHKKVYSPMFCEAADSQQRRGEKCSRRAPWVLTRRDTVAGVTYSSPCWSNQVTMLPWRMVIVGLISCCIKTGATRRQATALFPAASRTRRGAANGVNPTFHSSFADVHLLFEILLAGVYFEASGEFSVQDAELASLRKARNLKVICEDIIPRKETDIFRLISDISNQTGPLHQDDFERILLTLVYIAQQMFNSTTRHQRDVWEESFVSLYKAIEQDLTGTT